LSKTKLLVGRTGNFDECESETLKKGMKEKSEEYNCSGGKLYQKV